MNREKRIFHLSQLGKKLADNNKADNPHYLFAEQTNPWFVSDFIILAFQKAIDEYLDEEKLRNWASQYPIRDESSNRKVGIIMAGNIPLVGLHDLICAYISGNQAFIKLSSKDDVLMRYVLETLNSIDEGITSRILLTDRLQDMDAVIATGSNNSFRYFEYYFKNIPHILRRNRNSIAILDGSESNEELKRLADDIFLYFGLGCRNVSKLMLPLGYDVTRLFSHFAGYKWMHDHQKYMNNYDYQRTLLLMANTPHLADDIIMMHEHAGLSSHIAELYIEYYNDTIHLQSKIDSMKDDIQCMVGHVQIPGTEILPFGESQSPKLDQYADNADTLRFLTEL